MIKIIENRLITSQDDKNLYDYFLWENIIVKYFNDESIDTDELNSIDNLIFKYKDILDMAMGEDTKFDIDNASKVFYIIPLLIFCLEKSIEKVLK